jgi:hypothetical protein
MSQVLYHRGTVSRRGSSTVEDENGNFSRLQDRDALVLLSSNFLLLRKSDPILKNGITSQPGSDPADSLVN